MVLAGPSRAIFRAALPTFITRGLSSNAMINQARTLGVSYRRINMLADIREFSGLMKQEAAVINTASDTLVSKFNMVETDLRRARRYRGFAHVTYENNLTGEQVTQPVSFYDDELRTSDDWMEEFERNRIESEYKTDQTIVGFELSSVEHQAGWAY